MHLVWRSQDIFKSHRELLSFWFMQKNAHAWSLQITRRSYFMHMHSCSGHKEQHIQVLPYQLLLLVALAVQIGSRGWVAVLKHDLQGALLDNLVCCTTCCFCLTTTFWSSLVSLLVTLGAGNCFCLTTTIWSSLVSLLPALRAGWGVVGDFVSLGCSCAMEAQFVTIKSFAFSYSEGETLGKTRTFRLLLADPGIEGFDKIGEENTCGDTTIHCLLHWILLYIASPRVLVSLLGRGISRWPSCSRYTKSISTMTYPSSTGTEYSKVLFGNTQPVATSTWWPSRLMSTSVQDVCPLPSRSKVPPILSNFKSQTASEAEAQLLLLPPAEGRVLEGKLKFTPCACSLAMISIVTFSVISSVTCSLMAITSTSFECFLFLYMLQSDQNFQPMELDRPRMCPICSGCPKACVSTSLPLTKMAPKDSISACFFYNFLRENFSFLTRPNNHSFNFWYNQFTPCTHEIPRAARKLVPRIRDALSG